MARRYPRLGVHLLFASSATGVVVELSVAVTGAARSSAFSRKQGTRSRGCRMDAETRNFWDQDCRPPVAQTRFARKGCTPRAGARPPAPAAAPTSASQTDAREQAPRTRKRTLTTPWPDSSCGLHPALSGFDRSGGLPNLFELLPDCRIFVGSSSEGTGASRGGSCQMQQRPRHPCRWIKRRLCTVDGGVRRLARTSAPVG